MKNLDPTYSKKNEKYTPEGQVVFLQDTNHGSCQILLELGKQVITTGKRFYYTCQQNCDDVYKMFRRIIVNKMQHTNTLILFV